MGLHVEIDHPNGYTTRYGHLNNVFVKRGEAYVADPNKRESIIGISGNTGNSGGPHLHFELRNSAGVVVNPYGWQSDEINDPWANRPDGIGAISYNLWEQYPAVFVHHNLTDLQYPTAPYVTDPAISDTPSVEVDDSDPTLFTHDDCWTDEGSFHQVIIPSPSYSIQLCDAQWSLNTDTITPAGDYDVYARIPPEATALTSVYTIVHNETASQAVVVQNTYPNNAHGEWAYLGRYDFALNGIGNEYIKVNYRGLFDVDNEAGTIIVADAIRLHLAEPAPDLELSIVRDSNDAGGPNLKNIGWCEPESNEEPEIYFGHCDNGNRTVSGFRFDDVPMPDDATITAARLEFVVDNAVNSPSLSLQIRSEAGKDPATFDDSSLPSTRRLLPNIVPWVIEDTELWRSGGVDVSPDITVLVQAIIDQPSWEAGDAMVFIIEPTGSGTAARRVFARERYDSSIQATKLQIWFSDTPPAPVGLRAVYHDGSIGPTDAGGDIGSGEIAPNPAGHVRVSWSGNGYPTGTTFNLYRSRTGVPVPPDGRIGTGLSGASYWDDYGQAGDWYVVTAVNPNGESEPSVSAEARPPCPEC